MILTQQYVKDRLSYDPNTGVFTWNNGPRAGKKAGCLFSNGYVNIGLCGKLIGAHRLAWLYIHGEMPTTIDHIDGNPTNNRIANLRSCTKSQNMQNSRAKRNREFKGVWFEPDRRKWRAAIGPRGNVKYLGRFNTAEEAHAAYAVAAHEMYGAFARVA